MSLMAPDQGYVRTIEVERPVLGNNLADAQRLEMALKKAVDADQVYIPMHLLAGLPSRLREWDFKAKAVLFKDRRSWRLVDLLPLEGHGPVLGAAVDIGMLLFLYCISLLCYKFTSFVNVFPGK